MIRYRRFAALGAASVLGATIAAAPVQEVGRFGVQIPIALAPGASVQRMNIPVSALLALHRADLGDLRVVNGAGKAVPIALADAGMARTEGRRIPLTVYPILGAPGALKVTGVQLRMGDDQRAHIIGLAGAVDDAPREAVMLGTLLDTREILAPAAALSLDVDLPQSQPITFQIDASANLADWDNVARKVLYRAPANDRPVTSATIPLDGVDLRGRYVRISWTAASRLLSPVRIGRAVLTTRGGTTAASRVLIEATAPALDDAYHVRFALPFGLHAAALRILPIGDPTIIPIKLFGRENREQSWTELGDVTLDSVASGQVDRQKGIIELPEGTFREIRIDADPRSSGFANPPHVELQFAPRQVVALMSGRSPFTLAAGSASADNVFLPLVSLVPDRQLDRIPLAQAKEPVSAAAMLALPALENNVPRRTIILWVALIAATAVLGGIVWALFRAMRREVPDAATP